MGTCIFFSFTLVCFSSECCEFKVRVPISSPKSTEDCNLDVGHPDGDSNFMISRFVLYKICINFFFFSLSLSLSVSLVVETRHLVSLVEETA
jgi:hypothetical protein